MENVVFQTSLIAAFVAGVVALFAPCCITFLLPAYLGSVFKEKEKVIFATLIFGLGIFIVLLPAVLGIAFISKMLFRYHDYMYILGGLVMIIVAFLSFFGIKLPMPLLRKNLNQKTDVFSIFILGVFSGITSACCAPVLVGILTFAFLSPSFLGSILIGAMYVFGMVVPLLIISVFLSGKMPYSTFLKRPISNFVLFGKKHALVLHNLIASIIFFTTGILTLVLTLTGKLTMGRAEGFTKMIQNAGYFVNQYVGGNIFVNIVFIAIVIYFIYKIAKKV